VREYESLGWRRKITGVHCIPPVVAVESSPAAIEAPRDRKL